MPTTMNQVRAVLQPEEVDYDAAKHLGPDALPLLMELVKGGDMNLATKAAYLASLIPGEQSVAVVEAAASSPEDVLRVAAAAGIRNLQVGGVEKITNLLKHDPDVGVRKVMLTSMVKFRSPQLATNLQEMVDKDPEPALRELAAKMVVNLREN